MKTILYSVSLNHIREQCSMECKAYSSVKSTRFLMIMPAIRFDLLTTLLNATTQFDFRTEGNTEILDDSSLSTETTRTVREKKKRDHLSHRFCGKFRIPFLLHARFARQTDGDEC